MQKIIPPDGVAPGVYFDMPSQEYHASSALGSTDVRKVLKSPQEFHYTWSGNPHRGDDNDTEARAFGRAIHLNTLEGEKALAREFMVEPSGPGILDTTSDLKAFLAGHRVDTSGTKAKLIERVQAVSPKTRILDVIVEKAKAEGKRIIKQDAWERIALGTAHITKNPNLSESFKGGRGEVSVFWIRNGVRLKGRFDYLKAFRDAEGDLVALITDLKSFSMRNPLFDVKEVVNNLAYSYRMQAAHYFDGYDNLRNLVKADRINGGTAKDAEWIKHVASATALTFGFVFFKTTGYPYATGREFRPINPIIDQARNEIEDALRIFRDYFTHFGQEGPWVAQDAPFELTADDLKPWSL